jgi:acetylornithine deacetylase/succinyl-diaminopimelate desuccinylase-like protein
MGSAANAEVRSYIVDQLTALGLHPEVQTVEAPDYFGSPGAAVEVVNVMARIHGTVPALPELRQCVR